MMVLPLIYVAVTVLISLWFFLIPGFMSENVPIELIVRDKLSSLQKYCFSLSLFLFSFFFLQECFLCVCVGAGVCVYVFLFFFHYSSSPK